MHAAQAVVSESGSSSSGGGHAEQTGWSEAPSGPIVPRSPDQHVQKRTARPPAGDCDDGEGETGSGEIMPVPEGVTDRGPDGAGAGHVMIERAAASASTAFNSNPAPAPVDISGVELSLEPRPLLPRPAALY